MAHRRFEPPKIQRTVDRQGTSFLVPLGISAVFIVLAVLWVAQSGHQDKSSAPEVMSRPNAPSNR
jgi:hypothetical protein